MTAPEVRPTSLSLVRAQLANDAMACGLIVFDETVDLADLALDLAELVATFVRSDDLVRQIREETKKT